MFQVTKALLLVVYAAQYILLKVNENIYKKSSLFYTQISFKNDLFEIQNKFIFHRWLYIKYIYMFINLRKKKRTKYFTSLSTLACDTMDDTRVWS